MCDCVYGRVEATIEVRRKKGMQGKDAGDGQMGLGGEAEMRWSISHAGSRFSSGARPFSGSSLVPHEPAKPTRD